MKSTQEYRNAFKTVEDQVFSYPAKNRSEVMHQISLAHQAVRQERDKYTQEITDTWKRGYKTLKDENDSMQRSLMEAFREQEQMIHERGADIIGDLQK